MKTLRIILVVLGLINLNNKTNAQNTFQKNYGQGGEGEKVIVTIYGNYEVGQLNGDVYVSQFDNWGNIIWDYTYGGSALEEGNGIVITDDGKFLYVIGTTYSFVVNGINAAYVLKIDATNGNLIWSKSIYGDGTNMNSSEGYSVELTKDGGCVVAGVSSAFITAYGIFVAKLDTNGTITSFFFYSGLGSSQISADIKQTADGGYIICSSGGINFYTTSGDLLLLKLDSNFTQEWARLYGGKTIDYGFSVKETADHGFISTGYASSFSPSGQSIYVVRTDSMGDTLWTKSIGCADKMSGARSIDLTTGGFVITGYNSDTLCFLTKINNNGDLVWDKNIQFINTNMGLRSVVSSKDGGYLLTGQYNGTIYIAKADSTGNVGCNESDAGMTSVSVPTILTDVVLSQTVITPVINTPATIVSRATPIVVICSSNSVPVASNVNIVGIPYVGQILTGKYSYADADMDVEGVSKFRWLVNNVATGDSSSTYTVKSSDLGKYVKFEVTPIAQTGELIGLPKLSGVMHIMTDGMEELSSSYISVYPNPANNYLVVVGAEKKSLRIFDSLGKLVLEKEITSKEERIDLDLNNGMYFYSFGEALTKRIVILR